MEKRFIKAEIERTDKGLVAVASTAVEDRHGEVIEVGGWDLKSFKKNPVLLWAHDHSIPAIGTAKAIRIEGEGKKGRLIFEPVLHDATDFAKSIKYMVEELGVLNSFSVGFLPIDAEPMDKDGDTFFGPLRYTKQELLEISVVNVPANPDARVMAVKALRERGIGQDTLKALGLPQSVEGDDLRAELATLKAQNEDLREQISEVVKGLQHLNPQVDKREAVVTRLTLAKTIARAADKVLEGKVKPPQATAMLRVVKRANDRLIVDAKRELSNGKNQRTTR